jgi:cytochrome c5
LSGYRSPAEGFLNVISSKLSKLVLRGVLCLGLGASLSVFALTDGQKQAIEERITPVGKVCLQGDTSCGVATAAAAGGEPRSGEDVYNASCMACHGTGAAGAPRTDDGAEWSKRLAEKGLDTIHKHAIEGFNAMPPKGLCMTCSDDEVIAAVDYMLAAAGQ